jgi:hypothetical protein
MEPIKGSPIKLVGHAISGACCGNTITLVLPELPLEQSGRPISAGEQISVVYGNDADMEF